jgi:hypothetical protein
MKRSYTYNGRSISTKLKSTVCGKKYIISTAPRPSGGWQLAVFKVSFEIPYIFGWVNYLKPLRVVNLETFANAEKEHFKTEKMVAGSLQEEWQNWS